MNGRKETKPESTREVTHLENISWKVSTGCSSVGTTGMSLLFLAQYPARISKLSLRVLVKTDFTYFAETVQ